MERIEITAARPRARTTALLVLAVALLAPAEAPAAARSWTLGGDPCRLIPTKAATGVRVSRPIGTAPCPGVRPGALVQIGDSICTLNFLFKGSDRARYIGTAGHCILGDDPFGGDVGERLYRSGKGPVARDAGGKTIGRVVYAILQDPRDFALIRLDPGVAANPQMCWFGGPTGTSTDTRAPESLHYVGNGLGVGDVVPARSAVATSMGNRDHVYADGIAVPGDSGAGVVDSAGRAVGVLVTTGLHLGGLTDVGTMGITRLAPQEARAEGRLRISLSLVTARQT